WARPRTCAGTRRPPARDDRGWACRSDRRRRRPRRRAACPRGSGSRSRAWAAARSRAAVRQRAPGRPSPNTPRPAPARRRTARSTGGGPKSLPWGWSCFGLLLRLLEGPSPAAEPAQVRVDEVVEIAVQDRLDVALLHLGTQVLDHLIGLHHVRADLVAPR